ncbi:hypothetical protein GF361_03020 [Candidatus Woesearchaeota archaeon]|nr:hypothetical protein [Candidatus Woesearchaeota archaeon]
MKKTGLLIILSMLLLSIFAGAVWAAPIDESVGKIGKSVDMFLGIFEKILGGVFNRVIENPNSWLRIMFFVAVFAALYAVAANDVAEKILGSKKTGGILAFVIAFATAAVISEPMLYGIAAAYGGLIITVIMLIPVAILLGITYGLWQSKSFATYIVLWILWFTELIILSEWGIISYTIRDIGAKLGGTPDFVVGLLLIICLIALMILTYGILAFFGVFGDKSAAQKWGKNRWENIQKQGIKGIFGNLKNNISQFWGGESAPIIGRMCEDAEDSVEDLRTAITIASDANTRAANKATCISALENAKKFFEDLRDNADALKSAYITLQNKATGKNKKFIDDLQAEVDAIRNKARTAIDNAANAQTRINADNWQQGLDLAKAAGRESRKLVELLNQLVRLESRVSRQKT